MKVAIAVASLLGAVHAFNGPTPSSSNNRHSTSLEETKADLQVLGKRLNPYVGYWDPLNIADSAFWGKSDDFTIGWLRHSEIKHGRVSMAAFVGYCVQSNFVFPWALTTDGTPHPSVDLSPPEQWDELPFSAKVQIILFVGFLEFYSEITPSGGGSNECFLPHYTKGGIPGKYPTFDAVPHPVPFNLFDPFGFSKYMSPEAKERRLRAEINNGRLAMLGIFGFLCSQAIPGSVPLLDGITKPYNDEVMAPFSADFDFSLY